MTYIFLDFDGVTHPVSANGQYFRSENIFAIFNAIRDCNVKIIISSTWRLDKSFIELKELIGVLAPYVIGITPELCEPFEFHIRHREVDLYLEQHGLEHESWIAVDDTPAFYRSDAPLVQTNGSVGFTPLDGALI